MFNNAKNRSLFARYRSSLTSRGKLSTPGAHPLFKNLKTASISFLYEIWVVRDVMCVSHLLHFRLCYRLLSENGNQLLNLNPRCFCSLVWSLHLVWGGHWPFLLSHQSAAQTICLDQSLRELSDNGSIWQYWLLEAGLKFLVTITVLLP